VEDGTIAKDDCVGRNVTYTFSLIVPSGATVPPIGGGTGLSTVAISAPELMQWVAQPGATPQLATTPAPGAFGIVGAFSIVGGTRETAVPFPPGVPPPPPGVPLPTEPILSVVLFDELGEELRSLALGGYVDGRASAVVLSAIEGSERTDVLVSYGSIPLTLTGWNPDIDDFGASQVSPNFTNVTDVSPYGGNPESGGAVIAWFGGGSLSFVEYDPTPHAFSSAGSVTSAQFAGASGGPVSAFRRQAGGQTLFVTDGQPGELWTHAGGAANATKVGNLGNGPRQIRFLGEIGVVSNFDSGTLTVVRWENGGTVTIVGTVTVGDGPIGLDLRLNSAGNIEVLSTGFNNHTYTFTVLSPTGAVIGTPVTRTAPEGGLNPVHAIFVNAAGTRIGITCNGSDEVLIFDLPGS
jgi:hypothetical protein